MEKGRLKILFDLVPTGDIATDKRIIEKMLDTTRPIHDKNVKDIKKLVDYYYNKTSIANKSKTQQPDINNKIPINYAEIAVTTINAYCFANPLTFSARNTEKESQMKAFLDALDDDNFSHKAQDMYLNAGISGLGYRYIVPATKEQIEDGIYFETLCDLSPETTYCVYSNDLKKEKTFAVSFFDRKIYDQTLRASKTITVWTVWTKYHQWEFYRTGGKWQNAYYTINQGDTAVTYEAFPLTYGKIPVIENKRKNDGTGDFELAIALIDAIDALASSRLDAVQQCVDYIILLRDIDTESEGALERVKDALKDGILSFKSIQNATVQPEIDVLDTKLNQSEVQTLQDFLCSKVEEVLNIPNRETRSSGGDTGSAVESRNGFRSLENIAGLVTASAKKAENESLAVILAMCSNIDGCPFKDLKPRDIEIKDNRNKVENLNNASTSYATLRGAGMNDIDALIATRIVPDAQATAKKNQKEKEEQVKASLEQMRRQQAITGGNKDSEGGDKPQANSSQSKNGSNSQKADE